MSSFVKGQIVRIMSKSGNKTILITPIEQIFPDEKKVRVTDFMGVQKDYPFEQVKPLS